eukprot:scaffold1051_cov254-Pinguiococcus_pyrenoidosus.AAC.14
MATSERLRRQGRISRAAPDPSCATSGAQLFCIAASLGGRRAFGGCAAPAMTRKPFSDIVFAAAPKRSGSLVFGAGVVATPPNTFSELTATRFAASKREDAQCPDAVLRSALGVAKLKPSPPFSPDGLAFRVKDLMRKVAAPNCLATCAAAKRLQSISKLSPEMLILPDRIQPLEMLSLISHRP